MAVVSGYAKPTQRRSNAKNISLMIITVPWTSEVARDEIQRWRLQSGVKVHVQDIFGRFGSNPPTRVETPP
jgi:hypothetical protein